MNENPLIGNDNIDSLAIARDKLGERIAKGTKVAAELLAATDAENPKYREIRDFLTLLEYEYSFLDLYIYALWKESNAKVWYALPKVIQHQVHIIGDVKDSANIKEIKSKPRDLFQDQDYFYLPLTWYEYEHFVGPFLLDEVESRQAKKVDATASQPMLLS